VPASVPFKDVETMLEDCAEGYTLRVTDHNRRVEYQGRFYPSFPGRKQKQVKLGYVRSMTRVLGLNWDCVNSHFPAIRPPAAESDSN
jgi:hypothetical protein